MEGKISRINSNTDLVVDRISALPNSILGDILSFLPTKEAVATSLLSKRWRCAWVTVHNLDFCYHDPQVAEDSAENMDFCYHDPQVAKDSAENMAFIGFVHRVFFLIDAGPLNKFSLDWHAWTISSHVICWIDAAIKRNVRELSLYLGDGDLLKLPISGFNCDSLQSLEVHNFTLVHDATVVCLPRLESLKLDHVHFTSKETFEKLISGCPMLHYLNLTIYFGDHEDSDDVDADGDFMCIISSPSLRRLDIYFGDRCSLKLKASSLEYLRLHGFISEIFVEKSLSSLVQADFDIELDEHDLLNNSIVEAVRAFEHAKFLFLSVDVMRALGHATISLSTEFKRLVKLVARTYCCSVQDFIQNSENLEDLIMYQGYWQLGTIDPRDHSRWTAPVEVPRCLSNSLKKVRLDGYKGLKDEREMIRYMLEHGSALEVMDISCDSEEDVEKLELLQEICEFPRKSSACKVQFCVWPTKEKVPACDILTW